MAETPAPTEPMPWDPPAAGTARVVLVRHGRTAWNADGRFLGRTDLGLDDEGSAAALAWGAGLAGRFHAVWSSPLARAMQTARALGVEPAPLVGVEELDQGLLEGLTAKQAIAAHPEFFAAWAADPTHVAVPGGESLGALRDRAQRAIRALPLEPGQVVAVVTHQMVIAALCCGAHGAPLGAWRTHTVPNLCMVPFTWVDGALSPAGSPR